MKYLVRTRFCKEIVAEFLEPLSPSNKVVVLCSGMPSYPAKENIIYFVNFFLKGVTRVSSLDTVAVGKVTEKCLGYHHILIFMTSRTLSQMSLSIFGVVKNTLLKPSVLFIRFEFWRSMQRYCAQRMTGLRRCCAFLLLSIGRQWKVMWNRGLSYQDSSKMRLVCVTV